MKISIVSRCLVACIVPVLFCSTLKAEQSVAVSIAEAHGEKQWDALPGVQLDLELYFGGKKRIIGTMKMNPEASKSRIEDQSGAVIVFDGERAWITPAQNDFTKPRFEALTWPYFLAASFKLDDPGTRLQASGVKKIEDKMYATAKLTFGDGVGDSPDDWYVLYQDLEKKTLKAMAYIVTYGKSKGNVALEPHAIVYDDFQTTGGITLARKWRFYHWSEEKGVYGEPIGEATLSNISFPELPADTFERPPGAVEDKIPQE